jgi:hypothetical protein
VWDVWFLGQIVCYNIEHPSIINKMAVMFIRFKVELGLDVLRDQSLFFL